MIEVGFHPIATISFAGNLMAMHRKTWLVEMEVAVCYLAVAFVALALMLADTLWKSVAGKYP